MAEYIDLDDKIVVTDTRGRERETTVRNILDFNNGTYHAADVQPVVRGKWIRQRITLTSDAEIFLCSACTDISFRASRFCPNCGAKMEES